MQLQTEQQPELKQQSNQYTVTYKNYNFYATMSSDKKELTLHDYGRSIVHELGFNEIGRGIWVKRISATDSDISDLKEIVKKTVASDATSTKKAKTKHKSKEDKE